MPTYEQEIVHAARKVARLQRERRRLRRRLRSIDVELRAERKLLKATIAASQERRPDVVPSRVFGDGIGHAWRTGTEDAPAPRPVVVEPKAPGDDEDPFGG